LTIFYKGVVILLYFQKQLIWAQITLSENTAPLKFFIVDFHFYYFAIFLARFVFIALH